VGRFNHIDVKIAVEKNRTADGSDSYCLVSNAKFIYRFRDQAVNRSVVTAGAEVGCNIFQAFRPGKQLFHVFPQRLRRESGNFS
jgi:hypothetical protein